jgi:hypothetical protein
VVEVAGRFVAEQDLWVVGEGVSDGDALLLATRELRRTVEGARSEPRLVRGAPPPFPAPAAAAIICGNMTFSSAENSGSR